MTSKTTKNVQFKLFWNKTYERADILVHVARPATVTPAFFDFMRDQVNSNYTKGGAKVPTTSLGKLRALSDDKSESKGPETTDTIGKDVTMSDYIDVCGGFLEWSIQLFQYDAVLTKVKAVFKKPVYLTADQLQFISTKQLEHLAYSDIERIPTEILRIIAQSYTPVAPEHVSKRLGPLYEKLYPYQKLGVCKVISLGNAIIADEMGLGKTIQAIGVAKYYGGRTLIICPGALRSNWQNELIDHYGAAVSDIWIVYSGAQYRNKFERRNFTIISYDLVASILKPHMKKNRSRKNPVLMGFEDYNVLICDESHYVKSQDAQRTQAAMSVAKVTPRIVLLTGTPMSRSEDLYTQMAMVAPKVFDNPFFKSKAFWQSEESKHVDAPVFFGQRYCAPREQYVNRFKTVMDFHGNSNQLELNAIGTKLVWVRRQLKNVEVELPPMHRKRVFIDVKNDRECNRIHDGLAMATELGKMHGTNKSNPLFMDLWRDTCKIKVRAVLTYIVEYINNMCEQNDTDKLLIFAHHGYMLDAIELCLRGGKAKKEKKKAAVKGGDGPHASELVKLREKKQAKMPHRLTTHIRVDGKTPAKKRDKLFDDFKSIPEIRVAVLSITAAGVGLNLTEACHVIKAEFSFDPAIHLQAEKRIHRIKQKKPCLINYLYAKGTTDELVWRTICSKSDNTSLVVDGGRAYLNSSAKPVSFTEGQAALRDPSSSSSSRGVAPLSSSSSSSSLTGKKRKRCDDSNASSCGSAAAPSDDQTSLEVDPEYVHVLRSLQDAVTGREPTGPARKKQKTAAAKVVVADYAFDESDLVVNDAAIAGVPRNTTVNDSAIAESLDRQSMDLVKDGGRVS